MNRIDSNLQSVEKCMAIYGVLDNSAADILKLDDGKNKRGDIMQKGGRYPCGKYLFSKN